MKRLRPMVASGLSLLALGLAACGGSGSSSDTATSDSPSSEPPVATSDEPVGGDANERLVGTFTALSGATVDLAEVHDEDLVLWMWAPW